MDFYVIFVFIFHDFHFINRHAVIPVKLCFYDSPDKIKSYFKMQDYSKIFYKLGDETIALQYAEKYRSGDYYKKLIDGYRRLYGYVEKKEK